MHSRFIAFFACSTWLLFATYALAELDANAIQVLRTAESGGSTDQKPLAAAWRDLSDSKVADLPALLDAFEGATPVGENWLSAVVDRLLQAARDANQAPTAPQLSAYVLNASKGARGRETALELLRDMDGDAADQVIDKLLDDPVARLRSPAVAALLERAESAEGDSEQLALYQQAFEKALDERHVLASAVALRKLENPVDHIRKFGFIMHWQLIGPFDYADGEGFETAYPPESLDLSSFNGDGGIFSEQEHPGKDDSVRWQAYVNTARNGVVDLNKAIEQLRDVVAYGATVFESESDQDVEIRLRQQNSAKLWLNGELVFSQPVGHTGNFFDQYTVPVKLRKGPNLIVIKSCQTPGPVEHPFLNAWQFCVRVTDATGNAIHALNRPPTPELDPLPNKSKEEEPSEENEDETKDSN